MIKHWRAGLDSWAKAFSRQLSLQLPLALRTLLALPVQLQFPEAALGSGSCPAYAERTTPVLPMLCLTGCRVRRSRFSFVSQPKQGLPQGPIV